MIFVERRGKLELTKLKFRSDAHVLHVAQRIASSIGRRIDGSSPMLDARLADGSRVNVIISPLSLRGTCVSIRKFSRSVLEFSKFIELGTLSPELGRALEIAARCRLNIIISGGTGSGKTTVLNALSGMIDPSERIITIEDAVELQLQQPHVIQLETRPPNIEGHGEVTQRDLMRNCLRMRPDRIIVGECRGAEALDMLQAMNTGVEGSATTIHANSPRDAFSRLEAMVLMSDIDIPSRVILQQLASAIRMVVQISRLQDGSRKVLSIAEVLGVKDDRIEVRDVFLFERLGIREDGKVQGRFRSSGEMPRILERLKVSGIEISPSIFEEVVDVNV
jgi:pilus assembly protein CpaF